MLLFRRYGVNIPTFGDFTIYITPLCDCDCVADSVSGCTRDVANMRPLFLVTVPSERKKTYKYVI